MHFFSLLIKPVSAVCNLDCTYCFYKRALDVFPDKKDYVMPDDVLRDMIRNYLNLGFRQAVFGWQGGEPTTAGLDFFKRAVRYQREYGYRGQVVANSLQTNGVLIDDDWASFLAEYKFLIGISLDGPADIHDHYRKTYGGGGSHARVMKAIDVMDRHHVEYNILTLLNDRNIEKPEELYEYFTGMGYRYLQFIPCLETDPEDAKIRPYSIKPGQYARFLCGLFDIWYDKGFPDVSVREFDSILSYYVDGVNTQCTYFAECRSYLLVEHNGDVFPCDFFVMDEWRLGNVQKDGYPDMFRSAVQKRFSAMKSDWNAKCSKCKWLDLCQGDCTRYRVFRDGNPKSLNFFCHSMETFLEHTNSRFKKLAGRVREIRKANSKKSEV